MRPVTPNIAKLLNKDNKKKLIKVFKSWGKTLRENREIAGNDKFFLNYLFNHITNLINSGEGVEKKYLDQVSCKAGCGECCHIEVCVTEIEAKRLYERAKKQNFDILKAVEQGEAKEYKSLSKEKRRCVFLGDDQNCQIYEDRPLVCRSYRVVSDPILCDTDKVQEVGVLVQMPVELFISSIWQVYPIKNIGQWFKDFAKIEKMDV